MTTNRKARTVDLPAHALADWLNDTGPGCRSARATIATYIEWCNAGKRGDLPAAARQLFVAPVNVAGETLRLKPFKARLRNVDGLELAPFHNRDWAILRLVEVDRAGRLDRVRCCPGCGLWFAADNAKREYCTDNCRVQAWQRTPTGRASRAAYMRRHRETQRRLAEAKARGRKITGSTLRNLGR